ncbi:hypothetical protein BC829DRAFT_439702 [Chytridium lagenaria]|nr:hypothetical protein BC829DRAFT_439702 [Chytridium lagenaria]
MAEDFRAREVDAEPVTMAGDQEASIAEQLAPEELRKISDPFPGVEEKPLSAPVQAEGDEDPSAQDVSNLDTPVDALDDIPAIEITINKDRRPSETAMFAPVIAIDCSPDDGTSSDVGIAEEDDDNKHVRRLSKSISSSSISHVSSNSKLNLSGDAKSRSRGNKGQGAFKKSSTDLSAKPEISGKTTTLASTAYGTSFAGFTASAAVAEGTLIAHLPTTIHLAEKPSVASPHVMEPILRNTLMGKRMDASQATMVVQESLLTPAQAVAAKAPSGTSGVLVPRSELDSARSFLARKLKQRKLDNLANIALAALRQMKKQRTASIFMEGTGDVPDEVSVEVPAPVTRVEVLNRKLPDRRGSSAKSAGGMKTSPAWDSGLPVLKSYLHEESEEKMRNEMEEMMKHEDISKAPNRTLPKRPWAMPSLIPVPMEKSKKIEIVSVSLADLTKEDGGDLKENAAAEKAKLRKPPSRHSKKKPKPADGEKSRKMTVLTKKGLKLEVTPDKYVLGDDMTGVLAIKHNTLRGALDPSAPQMGPNLPGLESRPITSLLKKRFNEWDCPVRRRPDDFFSQYSQPLPITRENNVPQKQPTKRYHLLRELRHRREFLLQEVYLGQTAVSPKSFLKQFSTMEKAVQGLVGGQYHQTLAPTFNDHAPCHELFNELGQIHWRERAMSRRGERLMTVVMEDANPARDQIPSPPKPKKSPYAIPPSYLKLRKASKLVSQEGYRLIDGGVIKSITLSSFLTMGGSSGLTKSSPKKP